MGNMSFENQGEVKLREIATLFKEHELNEKWYRDNYEDLVERYDGVFVAIYKQGVIEHAKNPNELRQKILARGLKLSETIVEYVSKKPLEFIL